MAREWCGKVAKGERQSAEAEGFTPTEESKGLNVHLRAGEGSLVVHLVDLRLHTRFGWTTLSLGWHLQCTLHMVMHALLFTQYLNLPPRLSFYKQ